MYKQVHGGAQCGIWSVSPLSRLYRLDAPQEYKPLGKAGVRMVEERYSLAVCMPRMLALYEDPLCFCGKA